MKIVLIPRDPVHSPNMAANDAAILECIAGELEKHGADVTILKEDCTIDRNTDLVCHMTRTASTLKWLKAAEAKGTIVVNRPEAVEACSRREFMERLKESNVPQPQFRAIAEEEDFDALTYPAWIKRAEGWSCHKNDVSFAKDASEAKEAFRKMQARGITGCIHCCHIAGDLIKFYGVGDRYFHCGYPQANGKFGLESINGAPQHFEFSKKELHRIATEAAKAVGIEIYGGDCIVDAMGGIHIIDINDFPSFSAVRETAAKEITAYLIKKIEE